MEAVSCANSIFPPRLAAKGRTNVELREQFTLASGVSQSMTAFKSRPSAAGLPSPGSSVSGQRQSVSGPITKVSRQSLHRHKLHTMAQWASD